MTCINYTQDEPPLPQTQAMSSHVWITFGPQIDLFNYEFRNFSLKRDCLPSANERNWTISWLLKDTRQSEDKTNWKSFASIVTSVLTDSSHVCLVVCGSRRFPQCLIKCLFLLLFMFSDKFKYFFEVLFRRKFRAICEMKWLNLARHCPDLAKLPLKIFLFVVSGWCLCWVYRISNKWRFLALLGSVLQIIF